MIQASYHEVIFMNNQRLPSKEGTSRREYNTPQLKCWGTVSDITKVGLTNPGDDVWPGNADHVGGSITHSSAGGSNG